MSDQGIAFRATSGFVTDPANVTYCLADLYPTVRGGSTFGWSASISGTRDRDNTKGNVAGINFDASTTDYFQLDLAATGSTDIHAAFGDAGNTNAAIFTIKDTTTTIQAINKAFDATFSDATGANFAGPSQWLSGETAKTYTMASTALRVYVNDNSGNQVMAFLRAVQGAAATRGLFLPNSLSGLGAGGSFFQDRLQ